METPKNNVPTEPFVLGNKVPAQDTKDSDSTEDDTSLSKSVSNAFFDPYEGTYEVESLCSDWEEERRDLALRSKVSQARTDPEEADIPQK